MLSEIQLNGLKRGGLSEAELDAAAAGAAADQILGRSNEPSQSGRDAHCRPPDYLMLRSRNPGRRFEIDELRFGSSLDAVTPMRQLGAIVSIR